MAAVYRRAAWLTLALVVLPAVLLAAEPPLDGSYGNTDGCLYDRTGDTNGSDNFFLMTAQAITTSASYCEFKTVDASTADGFRATVTCQEEGSEDGSDFKLAVSRSGTDAYTIKFDDGTTWGPLQRCK